MLSFIDVDEQLIFHNDLCNDYTIHRERAWTQHTLLGGTPPGAAQLVILWGHLLFCWKIVYMLSSGIEIIFTVDNANNH